MVAEIVAIFNHTLHATCGKEQHKKEREDENMNKNSASLEAVHTHTHTNNFTKEKRCRQ